MREAIDANESEKQYGQWYVFGSKETIAALNSDKSWFDSMNEI
jgi:hypothetical protein